MSPQLDVFEITVTAGPMNAQTRVVSTKAVGEYAALRDESRRMLLDLLTAEPEPVAVKSVKPPVQIASFDA